MSLPPTASAPRTTNLFISPRLAANQKTPSEGAFCDELRFFHSGCGAVDWLRTSDLLVTNELLYQLSYNGNTPSISHSPLIIYRVSSSRCRMNIKSSRIPTTAAAIITQPTTASTAPILMII